MNFARASWRPRVNKPDEAVEWEFAICDERGPKTKCRCTRKRGHSGRHIGRIEGWYTPKPKSEAKSE